MTLMNAKRALSVASLLTAVLAPRLDAQNPTGLSYPAAQRGSQVDDYHGRYLQVFCERILHFTITREHFSFHLREFQK